MSLVDVMQDPDFETGTFTVTREDEGSYDADGFLSAGATSTFTIDAMVQPLSGEELQNLPQAQHAEEVRRLWTETELRTRDRADGDRADTVTIDGAKWEVVRVEFWQAFGESWYIADVAREVA